MDKKCVLVIGNLSDGFRFLGPFADFDAAAQFSETLDADSWVATLDTPEQTDAGGSELLAALKGLVEQLEGIGIPDWHGAEGLSLSQAKSAIAKAEGRGE